MGEKQKASERKTASHCSNVVVVFVLQEKRVPEDENMRIVCGELRIFFFGPQCSFLAEYFFLIERLSIETKSLQTQIITHVTDNLSSNNWHVNELESESVILTMKRRKNCQDHVMSEEWKLESQSCYTFVSAEKKEIEEFEKGHKKLPEIENFMKACRKLNDA